MARGKPFRKGFDRRRHLLTPADRRKAFATTLQRHPQLGLWLLQKCRQASPHPYDRCGKYY